MESSEFGENLPKGSTKANEVAQRAPWKVANPANLTKFCQMVSQSKRAS